MINWTKAVEARLNIVQFQKMGINVHWSLRSTKSLIADIISNQSWARKFWKKRALFCPMFKQFHGETFAGTLIVYKAESELVVYYILRN